MVIQQVGGMSGKVLRPGSATSYCLYKVLVLVSKREYLMREDTEVLLTP